MNKVIAFVLGAAAGSFITWKLVEKKYKQIADEEIESVIEQFKNRERAASGLTVGTAGLNSLEASDDVESEIEVAEYKNLVGDSGYSVEDEPADDSVIEVEVGDDTFKPYVIAPEEFGESDLYDSKSWTYYADFVLTDEEGEIISDPESIIGDALSHFGDYEDDSVYVRNEVTECDYEILKHDKTFSEVNGRVMDVETY